MNEIIPRMAKKVKKRFIILTLDFLIYVLLILIIEFKRGSGYFCSHRAFFE
jgi:hypothetical protein